jgi:hypothetical protein
MSEVNTSAVHISNQGDYLFCNATSCCGFQRSFAMKTLFILTALAFAAPLAAHADNASTGAAQKTQQVYHLSLDGQGGATAQNVH